MKIAIVGSRGFPAEESARHLILRTLQQGDELISGGAKGPDSWADDIARLKGLERHVLRPNVGREAPAWAFRKAAMTWNREIVEAADCVLAFWDGNSNGTANTIAWAAALGKPVTVITSSNSESVGVGSGAQNQPAQPSDHGDASITEP